MHPPFFVVDHKVDPPIGPHPAHTVPRRGVACRLVIDVPSHVFAPVPMQPPVAAAPVDWPSGPVVLRVVPPPQMGFA